MIDLCKHSLYSNKIKPLSSSKSPLSHRSSPQRSFHFGDFYREYVVCGFYSPLRGEKVDTSQASCFTSWRSSEIFGGVFWGLGGSFARMAIPYRRLGKTLDPAPKRFLGVGSFWRPPRMGIYHTEISEKFFYLFFLYFSRI